MRGPCVVERGPRAAIRRLLERAAREAPPLGRETELRALAPSQDRRELGDRLIRRSGVRAEALDVVHVAARVDRLTRFGLAPTSDGVEALEAEADAVDELMT